ncbi:MAG: conserved repeat domain protein [Bacteroidota bacterium]|nr:conserved repeat domain protein [Bacteroidota bacterium]
MPQVLTDPSILAQCSCNEVDLRHITVTGVSGLPAGVGYIISNGGSFNVQGGDSLGCAHFCGTPLVAGLYPVTVYLMADVTAIGTPIGNVNQNNVPQSYKDTLLVLPDTVAGVTSFTYGNNGSEACQSITVDLNALYSAPQPNLTRYFWNIANNPPSQLQAPGSYTFTNNSTVPDTFPITLSTVFYNYRVKKVHIADVTGGYCGDIEEATCSCISSLDSPDPYVKFPVLGFNNSNNYASNTCHNINFDNLYIPIPVGTFKLVMESWDLDNGPPFGTQDDHLGTDSLTVHLGQENFADDNTDGYVEFDTVAGTVITETLYVIVNPLPILPVVIAASDTFCSGDSVFVSVDSAGMRYQGNFSYQWYRDTVFLSTVVDSGFYASLPGMYRVIVTDQNTGCSSNSVTKRVTMATSPDPANIYFTGTTEFINPFPISGFAADWYYNGTLVAGQNGKILPFLGNGLYSADIYNLSYTSCRTAVVPDSVVSGIEGVSNSVFNMDITPNPNTGRFNLRFSAEEDQDINIIIQSTVGQIVYSRKMDKFSGHFNEDIDLNSFSKGIYFVTVESAKGSINKKVVVQ